MCKGVVGWLFVRSNWSGPDKGAATFLSTVVQPRFRDDLGKITQAQALGEHVCRRDFRIVTLLANSWEPTTHVCRTHSESTKFCPALRAVSIVYNCSLGGIWDGYILTLKMVNRFVHFFEHISPKLLTSNTVIRTSRECMWYKSSIHMHCG